MESKNRFRVIGMMSGTSLDGLDIACCVFTRKASGWEYNIEKATTVKYPATWAGRLARAHTLSGEGLIALDVAFGRMMGEACDRFIHANKLKADFIASHGHTIFHQPNKGFTYQLGNGNAIHAACGLPVICDFRSLDVLLGGEGAPLVPAGDKLLFHEYDVCLNLGGIANISRDIKKKRIAFDVCYCNMMLNYLSAKAGKTFDKSGGMASSGEVNKPLLERLNKYYQSTRERRPSLGREMFEKKIQPLLDNERITLEDRLRTCVESTAREIADVIAGVEGPKVLCTGGGAHNSFLISMLLEHCGDDATLVIPDQQVVDFKEAMVFAFLGVLRYSGEINCLSSVTHASRDSSAGIMIGF